jgi:hypothetical protein
LPVLRFHRDKRGYEYFSLVEPSGRKGKSRGRLLYWFRTPPRVKLGREPFDEELRRSLEAQYPRIRFDWARLLATPIPSAEDEMWRERRRAAKAARLAARSDVHQAEPDIEEPLGSDEEPTAEDAPASAALEADVVLPGDDPTPPVGEDVEGSPPADQTTPTDRTGAHGRRRRRRRGRRPTAGSGGAT